MTTATQDRPDWTDPKVQLTARSALARLGVKYPTSDYGSPTSTMLRERTELRRAIQTLSDQAWSANDKHDDATLAQRTAEVEAISALVQRVQSLLDAAAFDAGHNEASGQDVMIVNGQRTRVLRSVSDIRQHYEARASAAGQSATEGMDLASFLRGVAGLPTSPDIRAALTEGTDSQGGFSVPSLVMPQIMEALVPASTVLTAGAGVLPLDDGAKTFTQAIVDTIPTAAWRAEGGAVAESDPAFRGVVATPRSCAFLFKVSRELLMDGVGIEQALLTVIAQAFAKELDRVALRGSGTPPEPRGILNTTNVAAITNGAAGTALGTIKWSNLLDATKTILGYDAPMPTAAIMAPRTLTGFAALADSTGQPLQRPPLLNDVRFLATSQIPINLTVGASTDCSECYIGDFTKVLFAMREQVSIQRLNELYAATGQLAFVGHIRADVAVLYPRAFAVATGIRP